jgi:diguanylate cyclase (GGDEF)-like protein/PAS domain S-box-containing protein
MATLLKSKRLGWGIIFALMTAMAALAYTSGNRYLAAVHSVEHALSVQSAIDGVLSSLKDVETGNRGFILTGDPQFLDPYEAALRELPGELGQLAELTAGDSAQQSRLRTLRQLVGTKLGYAAETVQLRRDGDLSAAATLVRSLRGKTAMDRIRVECRAMSDGEQRVLAARKREAESAKALAIPGVGAGLAITVLLALLSLLTVDRDVTELRRTAEELAKNEEHYRLLTEHSSDLVRLLTLEGKASYVSPSVERMLGYSPEEYIQLPTMSLMHPSEVDVGRDMLHGVKSGKLEGGVSTYRLRHKSGEYRWFEVKWAVIRDAQGTPRELHTAGRDVTERRAAEQQLKAYADQLRSLSLRDELTSLYNRRGFLEIAAQAHSQALRDARPAALIFVDLNGMKLINDELGHDVGDQALVDTSNVLRTALREADVVARLGGDEFVAFALDFTPSDLEALRRRLRQLSDIRTQERERPFRLSMSVGGAYMPIGSDLSVEELLDQADDAMYEQKNARRAAGDVSIPPPAR